MTQSKINFKSSEDQTLTNINVVGMIYAFLSKKERHELELVGAFVRDVILPIELSSDSKENDTIKKAYSNKVKTHLDEIIFICPDTFNGVDFIEKKKEIFQSCGFEIKINKHEPNHLDYVVLNNLITGKSVKVFFTYPKYDLNFALDINYFKFNPYRTHKISHHLYTSIMQIHKVLTNFENKKAMPLIDPDSKKTARDACDYAEFMGFEILEYKK